MQEPRRIENLALIGFMGTGKSSVGHLLASLLQFQRVDTDELIEKRAGKRISDIFRQEGEPRFREYEREIVENLRQLRQTVISTGGGIGASPENLAQLKTHSLVVCLWASPQTIWERVRRQSHRPLLDDPNPFEKIQNLLKVREPIYRQADVLVNTELRSLREIAGHIVHEFRVARRFA